MKYFFKSPMKKNIQTLYYTPLPTWGADSGWIYVPSARIVRAKEILREDSERAIGLSNGGCRLYNCNIQGQISEFHVPGKEWGLKIKYTNKKNLLKVLKELKLPITTPSLSHGEKRKIIHSKTKIM